jgi:subtilisin family serine protease
MKGLRKTSLGRAALRSMFVMLLSLPALAGFPPEVNKKLDGIFDEGKAAFFGTVDKILQNHPLKSQLSGPDLARLQNGGKEIPYLFERLMVYAYQKDEPAYSEWARRGDKESLDKFRAAFLELAGDYAARFVGSLFRKTRGYDFVIALPWNRDKSRLDLVLQTVGFNARNDLPDIPKEKYFTNAIEPEFRSQWAIDALNVRSCRPEAKGTGIVVAVIDSGIDPYNSLFQDRLVPGFNFLKRTTPPWSEENPAMIDWGYHGTVCSSAVLAVAPECKIMPVRILDADTMNDPPYDFWTCQNIAAGIYYAVHHGAQVISLSSALPATELTLLEAVRYAYRRNVPICTSAGNISRVHFGMHLEDQMYKAVKKEVLLVGGVAREDGLIRPWPHTVPNDEIDVAAPSADVFGIFPTYVKDAKNMPVAGTSLAAPLAAGLVALLRGTAPPQQDILDKPGEYCRLLYLSLTQTACLDILGLTERDDVVGFGLMDAYEALRKIRASLGAQN